MECHHFIQVQRLHICSSPSMEKTVCHVYRQCYATNSQHCIIVGCYIFLDHKCRYIWGTVLVSNEVWRQIQQQWHTLMKAAIFSSDHFSTRERQASWSSNGGLGSCSAIQSSSWGCSLVFQGISRWAIIPPLDNPQLWIILSIMWGTPVQGRDCPSKLVLSK